MNKTAVAAALGVAMAIGSVGGASAAPRDSASISFFKGAGSEAHWAMDDGDQVIELSVAPGSYAGVSLGHVAGAVPSTAPSFDFEGVSTQGSPRIVVILSNRAQIHVHTGGLLATVGGGCPNAWNLDWAGAVACNPGTTVASAFMVADQPGTVLVDDLQWDGKTFGSAAGNRR